jgi:hypothetical protein
MYVSVTVISKSIEEMVVKDTHKVNRGGRDDLTEEVEDGPKYDGMSLDVKADVDMLVHGSR